MITETGKSILAKYMVGQSPAYASYISFGCGPRALSSSEEATIDSKIDVMGFEMFRAPIISRGYVTQNLTDEEGVIQLDPETEEPIKYSEVVLTAQMPTDERYEITEVGVWSAGANPSASANDSKMLVSFSESENWEYHSSAASIGIEKIPSALDELNESNAIDTSLKVFQADSSNTALDTPIRVGRNERPRFLNNSVFIRGDLSTMTGSGNDMVGSGEHIHFNGVGINLDKNAGADQIKIAFSVVNKLNNSSSPSDVKIILELTTPEGTNQEAAEHIRFPIHLNSVTNGFSSNRYFVVTKKLDELVKSQGFSWDAATIMKVYVSILDGEDPSDEYYVALDGVRLENVTTLNPLYGMVGYTRVRTDTGNPIIKQPNTSNMLEFRFTMDVQ
jgi:hypothetical protein